MSDEFLTAREAAKLLRIGLDSVYDGANRGDIPHRRIGRRILFSRHALVSWMNGGGKALTRFEKTRQPKSGKSLVQCHDEGEQDFDEVSASHSVH